MQSFQYGRWIWSAESSCNQYVLFARHMTLPDPAAQVQIRISASYHYELYINGEWIARGPVHGDPQWCQYDELTYQAAGAALHVAILVHHSSGTHLHYLLPAPGGLIIEFQVGNWHVGSDETWPCLNLTMWQDAPPRGWALDYSEDYDAALEPPGWADRVFTAAQLAVWPRAVQVEQADQIWGNYQKRMTPFLQRQFVPPQACRFWHAPGGGTADMGEVSCDNDHETLEPLGDWQPFDLETIGARPDEANALTLDLGREHIGFYEIEVDAPAGINIEISGAELLRDGRPWIWRKNTRYSVRYRTRAGRQQFTSLGWNGMRYVHLVMRGPGVRIHRVGCLERRAPLKCVADLHIDNVRLRQIWELCRDTLRIGVQEHLIDCPTREQTQYWGDALWIAESLWRGFGEPSYMEWYLECFLHVPFRSDGQLSSTYPGQHIVLLDYSLIPLLGQKLYRAHTGHYYRPQETLTRALRLKCWYDAHLNDDGLVSFDYEAYATQGLRNFIDHPGIGWHDFPHPGIDRHGVSCPLNLFFYGFVRILAELSAELDVGLSHTLHAQADRLAAVIRQTFYDGAVLGDAVDNGRRSDGASWQTNALAVFGGVIRGNEATRAMQAMLDGYDWRCRCSPYFYFYLLPALRLAGLEQEATSLIQREWGRMLDGGATTTWEGFGGDDKDSLCHPWSTAPFLFLSRGDTWTWD